MIVSAILVLFSVASQFGQNRPDFPVPRAEQEFEALIPHLRGYGGSIRGDQKAFSHAVLPYGPLDLQVTKAATHEEASVLRSFYLGIAGAASGVDAGDMANSFHCGEKCVEYRKSDVRGKVPKIAELVKEFSAISQLGVIAQWGIIDEYRVNNVFHMMGQTKESLPSQVMGFIPSDKWRTLETPDKYLEEIKVPKIKFNLLLKGIKELSLAAIVRTSEGDIRVVRVGIGDNEAGLLFLKDQSKKPQKGQKTGDGREYVYIEQIKPGIFYYETS